MSELDLGKLRPAAAKRIGPFLEKILSDYQDRMHSIHVTGTALTEDFDEKISDVNSVFVLKQMDLKFLELLAPLGKKYGKQRVSAPLIMTPAYIESSLDVFPIEFMNFKLIHLTVFGEDILNDINIEKRHLRHQCERELKTKLIWLRQGYLSSQGDRKMLSEGFSRAITDYIPLFRAITLLLGSEPPIGQQDVISALSAASGTDTAIFAKVLKEKHEKAKHSLDELNTIFEDYYAATEKLGRIIDDLQV